MCIKIARNVAYAIGNKKSIPKPNDNAIFPFSPYEFKYDLAVSKSLANSKEIIPPVHVSFIKN